MHRLICTLFSAHAPLQNMVLVLLIHVWILNITNIATSQQTTKTMRRLHWCTRQAWSTRTRWHNCTHIEANKLRTRYGRRVEIIDLPQLTKKGHVTYYSYFFASESEIELITRKKYATRKIGQWWSCSVCCNYGIVTKKWWLCLRIEAAFLWRSS